MGKNFIDECDVFTNIHDLKRECGKFLNSCTDGIPLFFGQGRYFEINPVRDMPEDKYRPYAEIDLIKFLLKIPKFYAISEYKIAESILLEYSCPTKLVPLTTDYNQAIANMCVNMKKTKDVGEIYCLKVPYDRINKIDTCDSSYSDDALQIFDPRGILDNYPVRKSIHTNGGYRRLIEKENLKIKYQNNVFAYWRQGERIWDKNFILLLAIAGVECSILPYSYNGKDRADVMKYTTISRMMKEDESDMDKTLTKLAEEFKKSLRK